MKFDPAPLDGGGEFVRLAFGQNLRTGPEIGPALLELGQSFEVALLGFRWIARSETSLLLALADKETQVLGDSAAESVDAGLGVFPGTGHRKGH